MALYNNRICQECGITFTGGPRAWYCEDCRAERRRRRDRNRHPSKRPIGSKDICVNCGKKYTVNSGLQKYCQDCMLEMHRKIDNKQGTEYYHKHYSTEDGRAKRNEKRRAAYQKNKDAINAARREKYRLKKAGGD